MRLNETKLVVFNMGLAREYRLVCEVDGVMKDQRVLKAQAALQSPGFDISPSAEPIVSSDADQVQWTWLIRPKSTGEHAIRMISEGQAGLTVDLQKILPPADWLDESPHQIVATIQVFTELGLTAREDAILKAIGAVLGIFGVVLGYPIFAMNRRRSPPDTADKELPDGWPTAKTRKALKQKVTTLSLDQWRLIQAVESMEGQGVHHVVEACGAVGPSEAYHRLRSLEADDLVALNKGAVYLSRAVKKILGGAKLTDLRH